MKNGDYMICSFSDGAVSTEGALDTFPAQVIFVDEMAELVTIFLLDGGLEMTMNFRADPTGPWSATGTDGKTYDLVRHDVYELENAGPAKGDVALITFADATHYLCYVEDTENGTVVQLFHQPYSRLTLDFDTLVFSEMQDHPAGEVIQSLQRCVFNGSVPEEQLLAIFSDGWCSLATRRDAFPGRIGAEITPFAIVLHTTDMVPESFNGLIHRWQTELGRRNGAHFVIGRDSGQGVVQLASIERNIGHAGGDDGTHGWFEAGDKRWHPNSVAVGIEIHCAGGVRQHQGQWRLFEKGVPTGSAIPDTDVIPDPQRPGRGWHLVTDWQYQQLAAILDGLEATLADLPEGCQAVSVVEQPAQWGRFADGRIVGHVSLDAARKSDPWPQVCDWARNWRAQYTN